MHIKQETKAQNVRQHKEYFTSAMWFRCATRCNKIKGIIYPCTGACLSVVFSFIISTRSMHWIRTRHGTY